MIHDFETRAKLAKKCPFCGSNVIKTKKPERVREGDLKVVVIKCDNCGAEVHAHTEECDPDTGYRIALKLWNRRVA